MSEPFATQPVVIRNDKRRRYLRVLLLLLLPVFLLLGLLATGMVEYLHKRGFYAPAWGPDGAVYYLERNTRGWVFTLDQPLIETRLTNNSYWSWVTADEVSVQRLDLTNGQVQTLRSWRETPVADRFFKTSAAARFGIMLATLNTSGGLSFTVNISVPTTDNAADLRGQQILLTGRADNVMNNMRELMAVPGDDFYPAAIISSADNKDYRVLLSTRTFTALYANGVPMDLLMQLSRREQINKQNEILAQRQQLIDGYQQQGLSRQVAVERADEHLAEQGYRVLEPHLLAIPIQAPEANERVFRLDKTAIAAGRFSDIVKAIESPGRPIVKREEPYESLDTTAAALNNWLASGQLSWVVAVDDRYYRLLIRD